MRPLGSKTSLISFDNILEKANIVSGHSLADLGCGNAVFFLYSLSTLAGKEGKVFGVDIQEDIIDTIKREIRHHQISGITPVLGNLDQLHGIPLDDELVDRAFLINTIHQSADIISMLNEASRILKRDGKLIIIDWDILPTPLGPHLDRRIPKETIKEAALVCGLKIDDIFKAGSFHYGLILAK